MLISYGSLGLGAVDNGAVVNGSGTHKCAFLSVRDNLAAFDPPQPNAPLGLEASYQFSGGGALCSVQEGPKQLCTASVPTSGSPLLPGINYLCACRS